MKNFRAAITSKHSGTRTGRSTSKVSPVYRGRRLVLMLVLLVGIGVLLVRAGYLEVFEQSWLQEQADKRQLRTVIVPPYRGMILDRNGESLAISSPVEKIKVNPQKLLKILGELKKQATSDDSEEARLAGLDVAELNDKLKRLEKLLGMESGKLLERLRKVSSRQGYYLERQVETERAYQIKELHVPTINIEREYKRFYPLAETVSHVVGFTDIDDNGIEGIERSMDAVLAGRAGRNRVVRDGHGRLIENIEEIEPMVAGQPVTLSLDHRIQYSAYKLLKGEVYKLSAKSGSVVVLDARTGEILAMANTPGFNPNLRSDIKPRLHRNRAVVDSFEPGSTLKPLTIAAALEARVIGADVDIETDPGRLKVGKTVIRDPKNYGTLSLARILAKSSNVGASKVALLMNSRDHWKFLSRVGFGRKPAAGFISEEEGKLSYYNKWGRVDRASHGYGYGVSVSLLQLAHAYTVFANDGVLVPVTIFKRDKTSANQPLGRTVMSKENAQAVLGMMREVVRPDATGKRAAIDGYHVAGKTGTAYKLKNKRYSKHHLVVSFVGLAPASDPRLVVAVMIDEPKVENASGGRLAAPLFSKIMANALRVMDIPPDNLPEMHQATPAVKPEELREERA